MRVQDMGLGLNGGLPLDERRFGIEIEVERCFNSNMVHNYWEETHDDSLREGGKEWITPPLHMEEVQPALEAFYDDFVSYKWAANTRTGTHVHVDIRDLHAQQLQALALAYALAERALCLKVGQDREENIYCVPWYRAPREAVNVMRALCELEDDVSRGARRLRELVKYAGLYFEPVQRFGTVEFRHAPTWPGPASTLEWVKMCGSMVEFAKEQGDAKTVYALWEQRSPSEFAELCTGEKVKDSEHLLYNKWFDNGASEGIALSMLEAMEPAEALGGGLPNEFFIFDEFKEAFECAE